MSNNWNLGDKIALIAAGAGFLQFLALIATVLVTQGSGQRQLRAYVHLDNAWFEETDPTKWRITYRIKNFGQTPAYKVKVLEAAKVVDWNNGKPAIPVATKGFSLGAIAPGGDFVDNEATLQGSVTRGELATGSKAIYLVGKVTYTDAFHRKRWTAFQLYIGGSVGCTGNELYSDDEGNDAV
jgi:hypothetical protein